MFEDRDIKIPNRRQARHGARFEDITLEGTQALHDRLHLSSREIRQVCANILLDVRKGRAVCRRHTRNVAEIKLTILRELLGEINHSMQRLGIIHTQAPSSGDKTLMASLEPSCTSAIVAHELPRSVDRRRFPTRGQGGF